MGNLTEITENYLSNNVEALGGQKAFDTLSECIDYAWNNWDDHIMILIILEMISQNLQMIILLLNGLKTN